jgi:hypothetical protein
LIQGGRYRRPKIDNFPKKTYAISRFLDKILLVPIPPNVPISPNVLKIYIKNNFVGVMNDVILMIEFLKFTLSNFNLIAFDGVLNYTHFGYLLHSNLL